MVRLAFPHRLMRGERAVKLGGTAGGTRMAVVVVKGGRARTMTSRRPPLLLLLLVLQALLRIRAVFGIGPANAASTAVAALLRVWVSLDAAPVTRATAHINVPPLRCRG